MPSNAPRIERQVFEKASRIRVDLSPCLATTSRAMMPRISTGNLTIALLWTTASVFGFDLALVAFFLAADASVRSSSYDARITTSLQREGRKSARVGAAGAAASGGRGRLAVQARTRYAGSRHDRKPPEWPREQHRRVNECLRGDLEASAMDRRAAAKVQMSLERAGKAGDANALTWSSSTPSDGADRENVVQSVDTSRYIGGSERALWAAKGT